MMTSWCYKFSLCRIHRMFWRETLNGMGLEGRDIVCRGALCTVGDMSSGWRDQG